MSFMVNVKDADYLNEVLWKNAFRSVELSYSRISGSIAPYVNYFRKNDSTEIHVYFKGDEFHVDAIATNEDNVYTNFELLNKMTNELQAMNVKTWRGV